MDSAVSLIFATAWLFAYKKTQNVEAIFMAKLALMSKAKAAG